LVERYCNALALIDKQPREIRIAAAPTAAAAAPSFRSEA